MFMHGSVRKEYVHPITEYVITEPLFPKGLRAYPYNKGTDNRWRGFEARKELMLLYSQMDKIKSRIPKLLHEEKIVNCADVLKRFIEEMKGVMRKKRTI